MLKTILYHTYPIKCDALLMEIENKEEIRSVTFFFHLSTFLVKKVISLLFQFKIFQEQHPNRQTRYLKKQIKQVNINIIRHIQKNTLLNSSQATNINI